MPSRQEWGDHLANAASTDEDFVAHDVGGAVDTVFSRRKMPTDVDFVPSDPPREISGEKWQLILQDVGDILNVLYGKRVFVCTLKFARDTVDKPLYQTMGLVTQQVVAALS